MYMAFRLRPTVQTCKNNGSYHDIQPTGGSLESVQHFALKILSQSWTSTLLSYLILTSCTLQHRRKQTAKILTILTQIHHNLVRSPLVPSPPPIYLTRHYSSLNYSPIFCKTFAFSYSFYPSAIRLCMHGTPDFIPKHIKSSTLYITNF